VTYLPATEAKIIRLQPDGPQGPKLGIAVPPEKKETYIQIARDANERKLPPKEFIELLAQAGITTFDASSL